VRVVVYAGWELIDWEMTFSGSPPLWRIIFAILIFIVAILLATLLSQNLPAYLAQIVRDIDARSREKISKKKEERQKRELGTQLRSIEKSIRRFIWWAIILIFGFIAFSALGYDIYTEFGIEGYPFTIWMLIQFIIIIIVFVLFTKTILSPITKLILQALFGRVVTKWTISKEHEKLETSMNALVILIGIYVAMIIAFPDFHNLPYYWLIHILFGVFSIIIGVTFATRLILFIFRVNYLIPSRMDIHAANAMENIFLILSILIIIGLILSFFRIDIIVIFGSLTFIGFAIAFGMQDSVANIMAGFMLAGDKPFVIGDRVRVGDVGRETWGDVIKIGLNTTRIRTVEGELVVIPNHLIAKNEIWNYTRESPVIVHKIDISISYGSDWRLAKKIIIDEARAHPRVQKNPQPFVRLDRFAESSIVLQLWIWLKHALDRDQIRSDLLEVIKDRFDLDGVEIPLPYRTIIYKKDLSSEKKLEDAEDFTNVRRYPSHGRDYFEYGDWRKIGLEPTGPVGEEGVRILVTSSNVNTAEKLANYSMDFAKKVNGKIIVFYVMQEYSRSREEEGLKILSIFEKMGKENNVLVGTIMDVGDVVETILKYTQENKVDFIIIGKSPKGGAFAWAKENIEEEIKAKSNVPVMTPQD
jgi:small-conductance mechanosensitive channel/nucleotide-binding universal stress UspA family protein